MPIDDPEYFVAKRKKDEEQRERRRMNMKSEPGDGARTDVTMDCAKCKAHIRKEVLREVGRELLAMVLRRDSNENFSKELSVFIDSCKYEGRLP